MSRLRLKFYIVTIISTKKIFEIYIECRSEKYVKNHS